MALTFQIIDSHQTLTNSDKGAFDKAQAELEMLVDKDNSPFYDKAQHEKLVEEDRKDRARRQELREIQKQTQWGRLQNYLTIRRKAYEMAYGPGSYPYQNDSDDIAPGTRTILILNEEVGQPPQVIGGFRMTFSAEGEDKKLRFEKKEKLKDVAGLLGYLPVDPGWAKGIKYAERASYNLAEAHEKGIRHAIEKLKYAEMGAFAIDPDFQRKGIGTRIRTDFFNYLRENNGLDGEAFFVVEATPASIKATLRAAEASGLPCIVRKDAGALIETSNGTPLPRTIIVLSHDAAFIEKMKWEVGRHNYELPRIHLRNIADVETYLQYGRISEGGGRSMRLEQAMKDMHHPEADYSRPDKGAGHWRGF